MFSPPAVHGVLLLSASTAIQGLCVCLCVCVSVCLCVCVSVCLCVCLTRFDAVIRRCPLPLSLLYPPPPILPFSSPSSSWQ